MQRMRESAQNQNMNRAGMTPAMMQQMRQNGVMNGNMNKQMYASDTARLLDLVTNQNL